MFTKNGVEVDIKNTLSMLDNRRKKINEAEAKPLPKTYAVNELAKLIHPGFTLATIKDIKECTYNTKVITLESKKFPFFRAGQYVTISLKINGKTVTRPYSIFSSPNEAMNGILKIGIQTAGFFSTYLNNNAKVGDKVVVSEPLGDFYHDSIRDKNHIFAIAGGSGITPFYSMIQSILEGSEDFKITVLYGVKTQKDIMIPLEYKDNRIKVIPVYSNEEVYNAEHGFINKDIIKKYLPNDVSIFMCGNNLMYQFALKEIDALGISLTSVRSEHNCTPNLKLESPKEFNLIVHMRDQVFNIKAKEDETLLVAMERAGLAAPSRCRSGFCGFCHSRLIKGTFKAPIDKRRIADKKYNYIHPCCSYPTSDIEIDVPPIDALKEL